MMICFRSALHFQEWKNSAMLSKFLIICQMSLYQLKQQNVWTHLIRMMIVVADKMVAHGTDIPDAMKLYAKLSEDSKSQIKFFYVKPTDIDDILPMVPANIRSYPGTMLVYQVGSTIFFNAFLISLNIYLGNRGCTSLYL